VFFVNGFLVIILKLLRELLLLATTKPERSLDGLSNFQDKIISSENCFGFSSVGGGGGVKSFE